MTQKGTQRPSLLSERIEPDAFRGQRRQAFLTWEYYRLNDEWIQQCGSLLRDSIAERRANGNFKPLGQRGVFVELLNRVLLHYTAGESLESVSQLFDDMFSWFCKWHFDYPVYLKALEAEFGDELHLDASPVNLDEIEDYHRAATVLSLAVLLSKGRELLTLADLFVRYRGEDLLIEELLSPAVDRVDGDEFFHVKPYDPLIDAFVTAEAPAEASVFVKKYLDGWYQAMERCAWHNGHTIHMEHMTPYNGYWSFESAAICLIHGIDDSSFRDNIVYPKDLIDWARANDSLGKLKAAAEDARRSGESRLRCQSGDACPRDGYWFTPARADARQYFRAGQAMPDVGGPWGLTIWQSDT